MTAPPVIDPAHQADFMDAFEPAVLDDLLDQFLAAIDRESAAILACEQAGDRSGLEQAAHRLASAAGQFGFPELTAVARALEAGRVSAAQSDLRACLARATIAAAALQRRPTAAR